MFNLIISLSETPNCQIVRKLEVSFQLPILSVNDLRAGKNVEVTEEGEWVEQATQMEKSVSGCSVASTPEHHTGGATSSNKSFPAALAVCQLGGGASLCGD